MAEGVGMKLRWVNRYTDLPPFFLSQDGSRLQKTERVLQYWVAEFDNNGISLHTGVWVDVPEEEE